MTIVIAELVEVVASVVRAILVSGHFAVVSVERPQEDRNLLKPIAHP